VLIVLSKIDLETRLVPNRIVLPAIVLILAAQLVAHPDRRVEFLVATVGSGLFLLVPLLIYPAGMGLGDVKLAGVLGLFLGQLGIAQLTVGIAAGFFIGAVVGLALILAGRARRGSAIPYGPWMLAGAWFGVLFGAPAAAGYLALVGLS